MAGTSFGDQKATADVKIPVLNRTIGLAPPDRPKLRLLQRNHRLQRVLWRASAASPATVDAA
jgi:hypothetical protein